MTETSGYRLVVYDGTFTLCRDARIRGQWQAQHLSIVAENGKTQWVNHEPGGKAQMIPAAIRTNGQDW